VNVYRLHRAARAPNDYTGAMLAGGRWNPIGVAMLYTARHLSLACLEVLVHLDKGQFPRDYVWSRTELHAPRFLKIQQANDVVQCQAAGLSWLRATSQLAVQVPSALTDIPAKSSAVRFTDSRPVALVSQR
jgi:RES domain-containing protein